MLFYKKSNEKYTGHIAFVEWTLFSSIRVSSTDFYISVVKTLGLPFTYFYSTATYSYFW